MGSLRQSIQDFEASRMAYNFISVEDPSTRCTMVEGLVRWARHLDSEIDGYLEKINKGECSEVLAMDFRKLARADYWLSGRMKKDMTAYSEKPLAEYGMQSKFKTSAELYAAYEEVVTKIADKLKMVKSTFSKPELYDDFMLEMRAKYLDSQLEYEYEHLKEEKIELTLQSYLEMQVEACVDFLKSGALRNAMMPSPRELQLFDEDNLYNVLPCNCQRSDKLKQLWAMFRRFNEVKDKILIVPKRDQIRKYVLSHFYDLSVEQLRALFRLDYLLMLIHQDMVKLKPELAEYLKKDGTGHFAFVNTMSVLLKQKWFDDYCTNPRFNHKWIERFFADFISKWGDMIAKEWRVASKHTKLKCRIIGALKDAGVLETSYQALAELLDLDNGKLDTSLANYMGEGKKQPYFEWICDYVNK